MSTKAAPASPAHKAAEADFFCVGLPKAEKSPVEKSDEPPKATIDKAGSCCCK